MTFTVQKGDPLLIYGCSSQNIALFHALKREGYSVRCFIDRNAEQLNERFPIPVVTLSQAGVSGESVILLCLQNAMQHESVAEALYACGARKVLCLSASCLLDEESAVIMLRKYRALLAYRFSELQNIPLLKRRTIRFDPDECILQESGATIIWLAPVALLFSRELHEASSADAKQIDSRHDVSDRCIPACYPYIELFRYLDAAGPYPDAYLDVFARSDASARKRLLADRAGLYQRFMRELERGLEYFVECAPDGRLSADGKFVIPDGIHRISFLTSKGFRRVPIRTSREDFRRFVADPAAQRLLRQSSGCADSPYFEHPAAYAAGLRPDPYPVNLLLSVMDALDSNGLPLRELTILEVDAYRGFIARGLLRAGARDAASFCSGQACEFIKDANELFHSRVKCVDAPAPADVLIYQIDDGDEEGLGLRNWIAKIAVAVVLAIPADAEKTYALLLQRSGWQVLETRYLMSRDQIRAVSIFACNSKSERAET